MTTDDDQYNLHRANRGLQMADNIANDPASPLRTTHPYLTEATLALALIHLTECAQIFNGFGFRLTEAKDLPKGDDLTDHLSKFRNAICHIGSSHRHLDHRKTTLSFVVLMPNQKIGPFNDDLLENPYEDDIAFYMGTRRLLYGRHLGRAIENARAVGPKLAAHHSLHWWPI